MSRAPSPATLSRAAEKLRSYGELKLADALAPRKSLKPAKSKRGARVARHLKRDLGKITWADVKQAVRTRVLVERGGRCEWACERLCDDPHHLISGSGKKRVFEAPNTVSGICRTCHRLYEKADVDTLQRAASWALNHGFTLALNEILRRLDKAIALRSSLPAAPEST